MRLNRALQREWLERLSDVPYPGEWQLFSPEDSIHPEVVANLWYLEEHGLITCQKNLCPLAITFAGITARGMDFLSDDGGLSAILGSITVKLHADTLRDLLSARIAGADLPDSEKETLMTHIRTLPAKLLEIVATRALEEGMNHLPDAIPLLRRLLVL